MIILNVCPPGTFVYHVRFGDTLWSLAARYHTTVEDLLNLNPGIDPDQLFVGQSLCLPLIIDDIDAIDEIDEVLDLNNLIRLLWQQHIIWTRLVIQDFIFASPELDFAIKRLLQNPVDFANLLEPFYGTDFSEAFRQLLTDHLVIALELVKAAKANDTQKFEVENRRWFENADALARLLADNNPFWDYNTWQEMLYQHLELVKNEATFFLNHQFEEGVALFDDMQQQAMAMSDLMLEGIMRQFPEDFEE